MSRLAHELQRLFRPHSPQPTAGAQVCPQDCLDADGRTKALVLQLSGADAWQQLGGLWRALQTDLGLPAPAIAINGHDAVQLWLPLAEPVARAEAAALLQALCRRWLPAARSERLVLHPAAALGGGQAAATASMGSGELGDKLAATTVPAAQPGEGDRWSAFVAPDLAPLFEDTPWLDGAPGDDAQASLLARIEPISAADWREACRRLGCGPAAIRADDQGPPSGADAQPGAGTPAPGGAAATGTLARQTGTCAHPQALRLLEAVVADASAPLALRVQAAVALLPYGPHSPAEAPAAGDTPKPTP